MLIPHVTEIAWVNDLAIPRYEGATQTLIGEASQEASLVQKKVNHIFRSAVTRDDL